MWIKENCEIGYKEGFYIFGGSDGQEVLKNDLWLVQPDYKYNKVILSVLDCDFISDLEMGIKISKIEDYSGRPPCPRSHF